MSEYRVVNIPARVTAKSKWGPLIDAIRTAPAGKAIEVPLEGRKGDSLHSTLYVVASRAGLTISARVVGDHLYVWRRENGASS